ncbi:MAG: phosphatase PAP2 family protein [Acidimicrobiia bacterium]|nr:phosphatase PAP2 family protein [Acidimicrobiia bacterium]
MTKQQRAVGVVALGLAGFAVLAALAVVAEPTLLRFDQAMQAVLLESRSVGLNHTMVVLTFLGTRWIIGAATVALVIWSAVTRRHRVLVAVVVAAVLLNPVLEVAFKELIGRVRPAVAQLLPGNGPSFPSGHVLAAVGFYGLIPLLTWEATRNRLARAAAVVGSGAIIAAVTVSRPYLDVHWTTDALAGVLLGSALVAATYLTYLRLQPAPAIRLARPTTDPAARRPTGDRQPATF